MERDILDILKAFEEGKLTIIETHKKICGMIPKGLDTFSQWFAKREKEINIELRQTGADRELNFNPELEFEIRYALYCKIHEDQID